MTLDANRRYREMSPKDVERELRTNLHMAEAKVKRMKEVWLEPDMWQQIAIENAENEVVLARAKLQQVAPIRLGEEDNS